MRHLLYNACGNTLNLEEYLGFFEIEEGGYCVRYIEIQPSGVTLKYDREHEADELGVLPEGIIEFDEISAEVRQRCRYKRRIIRDDLGEINRRQLSIPTIRSLIPQETPFPCTDVIA